MRAAASNRNLIEVFLQLRHYSIVFLQVAEGVRILGIAQLGEGCGGIGMVIAILMARAIFSLSPQLRDFCVFRAGEAEAASHAS